LEVIVTHQTIPKLNLNLEIFEDHLPHITAYLPSDTKGTATGPDTDNTLEPDHTTVETDSDMMTPAPEQPAVTPIFDHTMDIMHEPAQSAAILEPFTETPPEPEQIGMATDLFTANIRVPDDTTQIAPPEPSLPQSPITPHPSVQEMTETTNHSPLMNSDSTEEPVHVPEHSPASTNPVHTMWIHKKDYKPITLEEKDLFHEKLMKKFLDEARKGFIIDLKITSNVTDLDSGKLKIVTENPDTIEIVRSLLDDNWCLLSPDDLSTSAGQGFWIFCPASLNYFISTDSILELF
jgi:hypothetical protein